eukprot:PITA_34280
MIGKARIIGRGKVKLKLQGGRVRTLLGVLHIPALARNLIFLSKLDDAGVKAVFENDTCKMVQGALVLMRGVWIGTMYKLQGSTVVDGCNSSMVPENGAENLVVSGEKTMLWHQRLGHIGEKGLRILHGKGMVEGMSNRSLDFDFCENCVYGKQNQVSFPSGGKRTKQILELVHSDVFGPVKVPSLGFKEFKALVENQTKKKIKVLRTDNGGEFYSKEFEEFCKKCGMAWQKTTPYTPQQNEVAERMNKTLMERARSMLSVVGLGQEFWAEAVDTACYLVNRSPSSALDDKTPQEVWTGKKPSLPHLKGYKLWNPVTRKVVYNQDVVFREVKDVIKHEVQPKEPVNIEFELKEEESDSVAEEESEDEEPQTPAVRRSARERRQPEWYSPSAFCSNFALSVTDDDPRTVKEAVDSEDGKL